MSKYFLFLQTVHDTVHDLGHNSIEQMIKKNKFSPPKIFTGGVNINDWNKLTTKEKETALSKDWYIYYSFRDEKTGKLKRMPNVKGGVNRLKTFKERMSYLNTMKDALEYLLEKGLNPYAENDLELLLNQPNKSKTLTVATPVETNTTDNNENIITPSAIATKIEDAAIEDTLSITDAFDFALKMKRNAISETSYKNFELRIRNFKKSLDTTQSISSIDKKSVNNYLNAILEKTSARNRNNTRTDLSSLFQVLEDNDIIKENFIKKISVLKSKPERNKTYTPQMQIDIYEYLEKVDPLLLLFIKFVSYNFLRPVEVCRLKVKDIDIKDRKLYLKAKNKAIKIKLIPEILVSELPNLSIMEQENYLFSPNGYGLEWEASENNRRDHFSKRFKEVVKDKFNLGIDYGMYSFRHTFITKLYRELRKLHSQFETKSILMLITGHSTMVALEHYLRDIDAEIPEDYSDLLK